jgi:chromosome segregation ATPase
MNKFQQHLPKILGAASILFATGFAVITLQVSSLKSEITNLQADLKEKSDQIAKMQEDLGSEVSARSACEASIQPFQEQISIAEAKLEAFALQASACERIRLKLKK